MYVHQGGDCSPAPGRLAHFRVVSDVGAYSYAGSEQSSLQLPYLLQMFKSHRSRQAQLLLSHKPLQLLHKYNHNPLQHLPKHNRNCHLCQRLLNPSCRLQAP